MDIVIRATIVYVILYLFVRVIGRRELSEMTPFDLVLLIVLGDLVQQGVTQEDMSITGAALAGGTMVFWVVVVSWASYRWQGVGKVLRGQPILVVRDGEIIHQAMTAQRVEVELLHTAARQQGIGDLDDVRYGVLESDGMFSFLKKEQGGDSLGEGTDKRKA